MLLLALTQAGAISAVLMKHHVALEVVSLAGPGGRQQSSVCESRAARLLSLYSPGALALRPGVQHQTDPTPSAQYHPHRDFVSVQAKRIAVYLSLRHAADVGKY